MTVTGGGVTIAEDLLVSGDAVITGDLTVNGTTTSVDSTNVLIADNNLLLSSNYTTAVATDIILVSGAADPSNNGLFEILSTALNVITVDPTPTFNFLNSVFVADGADTGAAVTKVTVAVIQAGADGRWEVASGSDTSLAFVDLALVSELPSGTWTEVTISTTNATPDATTTIAITALASSTLEVVYSARTLTETANALNGKFIRPFYNASGTATAMGAGTKDESRVGAVGWSIASSGTGASMVISVTGAAATDIEWKLLYRATENI